jgi:hypothetical protein
MVEHVLPWVEHKGQPVHGWHRRDGRWRVAVAGEDLAAVKLTPRPLALRRPRPAGLRRETGQTSRAGRLKSQFDKKVVNLS